MIADRTAFLFPGQGSQLPGMGAELRADGAADRWFAEADEVLGFPLSRLCREGTAEELADTAVAQPAIMVTSLVALHALREQGIEPVAVAGHSVGEYAALVAAGVLEWTDALRLVHRRGALMAAAARRTPGGMAAILGVPGDEVARVCARVVAAVGETVAVANDNAPSQTVVSGTAAAVAAAGDAARELGAEVVVLKVSAPFHCGLMGEVAEEFAADLDRVRFATPKIPVVANVTADWVLDGEAAAVALRDQVCAPVRWRETVALLARHEMSALVEVGPGRVLTNLARLTVPDVPAMAVGTSRQLATAITRLRG